MSRPRDMEPDTAVSSRPVAAVHWLLLAIALAGLIGGVMVQYSVLVADPILAIKVARVSALAGLLAALAALPL